MATAKVTYARILSSPVEYPRACIICGVKREKKFFYRKKQKGPEYRRASCSICDRKRYPRKPWKPRHHFDRRKIYVERKTSTGIREKLLKLGWKSGTKEYVAAYQREYVKLNPEDKKLSQKKYRENKKGKKIMIKLLIVFEGLGLGFSPFISSSYVEWYLAAPLKIEHKISYEVHGWLETSLPCRPNSMAVGHSYGGRAALLYAERCKTKAVILDDRPPIFARCTSETKREVTAFYRGGSSLFDVRGCPVKGAENVKLPSSVGHVQVPADPGVKKEVRRLMGLQ